MTNLTLATLAPLLMLQPASDSVLAGSEYTIEPEQWELSYDIAIQPYLDDYKRCLGYGNLVFNGEANVEIQHRQDVPRCETLKADSIADSNAALVRRGRSDLMPPADVERAFTTLAMIHIERGRNLDAQFMLQQRAIEEAQARYQQQIAARGTALTNEPVANSGIPDAQN